MELLLFTSMFFYLYHCQDFLPDLTVYMSDTVGVLLKAETLRAPEFTPACLEESVLLIFFSFVCCPIMLLYVLNSVL